MISLLDSVHQKKLLKKWAPILEAGQAIESDYTKLALAQVLENTARTYKGLFTESNVAFDGVSRDGVGRAGIMGGVGVGREFADVDKTGTFKGAYGPENAGANGQYNADYFMPNVVMPMLRRIFPDLIANELCGVQPLNGPIGFALALRAKYNRDGTLTDNTDISDEIGYHPVDTRYTGEAGDEFRFDNDKQTEAWNAYAGTNTKRWNGRAVDTADGEYVSMAETYPTVSFDLIKTGVQARTRKLGAQWSPELAEDMEAMHGIDVEAEMVNILSYEIGAEIDRQIVTEMVKCAITGGNVVTWNAISADGLDQMGRLATLLTQITIESNNIALRTRRGSGNFVIASPKVCSLLQQMTMNKFVSMGAGKSIPSVPMSGVGAIQKQGLINDGCQLLVRDAYATGDYVLMGYKGTHPGDSGIIYCPYIPVQLNKVLRPDTFTPTIGARTRYGVMDSPWDSGRYYCFMKIDGVDGTNSYAWGSDRQFVAPSAKIDFVPPTGTL